MTNQSLFHSYSKANFQKLFKYFNETTISTSNLLLSGGVLPIIFLLLYLPIFIFLSFFYYFFFTYCCFFLISQQYHHWLSVLFFHWHHDLMIPKISSRHRIIVTIVQQVIHWHNKMKNFGIWWWLTGWQTALSRDQMRRQANS